MKRFLSVVLLIIYISVSAFSFVSADADSSSRDEIAILFTHDLHSHLEQFKLNGEYVGGFSKIKTIIDDTKNSYPNTIVVDAGDFSMGTLYQTLFETQATEYTMLAELGYDATAFGNHEFDYGFDAIKNMVSSAKGNVSSLPPILCSNIDTKNSNVTDAELNALNIKDYTIINTGEITIAVFGVLGKDAVELSSSSGLVFEDYITSAKNTVIEIKNLYSPDMIVCLSHSGTGDDVDDEDIKLAEEVPDIDFIVSAHTHTTLNSAITVGNTVIGSCGEYGEKVGKAIFERNGDGYTLKSYELIKIDNTVPSDSQIQQKIDDFKSKTADYLARFGYESFDEVLAYSPFDFPEQSSMGASPYEQQLGNLISDSYIYALKKYEGDSYINVDVAIAPYGVIRSSIDKGDVTVSQVFEISSLGIGNDGVSGYPLCTAYLYGRELWDLAEVDASVSSIIPYARLYCSGLRYSVNTNRMFLNKVYDCWLVDERGNRVEIEDDKLYRVVSGMSSVILLGTVKEKSFGLLQLVPKDANGNEITDFDKHIALDRNGSEIKEWKALADYLASFPKNDDGVPQIPYKYERTEGRKTISGSLKLSELFTNWSLVSWIIFALILILIAIIVLSVSAVIKKRKKNKKRLINEIDAL